MAPANRPSKDKRNARNRARREAFNARSEAARKRGEQRGGGPVGEPKQGLLSRFFSPRPAIPFGDDGPDEDGPTDDRSAEDRDGRPASKGSSSRSGRAARQPPLRGRPKGAIPRDDRGRPPGHRAVLFALFFAIASVGLLVFVPVSLEREVDSAADAPEGCEVQEPDDDADPDDPVICIEDETIPSELGLMALPILAVPVVLTGIAFRATTRERQARTWTWCLVAFAVFLFAFPIGGIILIPSLAALTVASFQARKAEQRLLVAEHQAGLHDRGDGDADDDVIDTTASDDGDEDGTAGDEQP